MKKMKIYIEREQLQEFIKPKLEDEYKECNLAIDSVEYNKKEDSIDIVFSVEEKTI